MIQKVLNAYHRFAKKAGRSARSRPLVSLNVVALEERATPAAAHVPLVAPPLTVLVAPVPAPAAVVGTGSLAVPMVAQSMVRLDLIGPGDTSEAEQPDESVFTPAHRPVADAPSVTPTNGDDLAVSDEELAELLAAQTDA